MITSAQATFVKKCPTALRDLLYFVRTQRCITAWAGPVYQRSRNLIEIDVTYACNLKCFNCNRSCGLAPSEDKLSLQQIRRFLGESRVHSVPWQRIRVLGGEPTLHPEFLEILDELLAFKKSQGFATLIEVVTNGFGKSVNDVLTRIPAGVLVRNTRKKFRQQDFQPFNLAPRDYARYRYADFSCGCYLPAICGIGLSPFGYYACAVAAGVDRVLGFDLGRKTLPHPADPMRDQMEVLCGYCGHFMTARYLCLARDWLSRSWRRAYTAYQVARPRLTLY